MNPNTTPRYVGGPLDGQEVRRGRGPLALYRDADGSPVRTQTGDGWARRSEAPGHYQRDGRSYRWVAPRTIGA